MKSMMTHSVVHQCMKQNSRSVYTRHESKSFRVFRDRFPCGRFRAKMEHLKEFQVLLPESQGQNMALTVVYVPYSLGSGRGAPVVDSYFTEMCSGSEEGSYLRLMEFCITQL